MRSLIITVLVILVVAALVFFLGGRFRANPPLAGEGSAQSGASGDASFSGYGVDWVTLRSWDFANGLYPGGWGWGDIRLADGTIELRDSTGKSTVYFAPLSHGGDFVLESRVQLVQSQPGEEVAAHLITRDSQRMSHETGVAIFGGSSRLYARHRVNGVEHAGDVVNIGSPVTQGVWYDLRLTFCGDEITISIDDRDVWVMAQHPGGWYNEPHFGVVNGIARFKGFRLLVPSGSDLLAAQPGAAAGLSAPGGAPPGPAMVDRQPPRHWLVTVMLYVLYAVIFVVCVYMIRHFLFTLNRLFGNQRHPYLDVDRADWPRVTVLIPAHNEEPVLGEILTALLDVDYPKERLTIVPINDRSGDKTKEIMEGFARRHPTLVRPYHRHDGTAGKAAALQDAMEVVKDEIVLVFDADYIPGKSLIKQLVAPFFDPEVGAVMGRVVPHNVNENLLTRMLDLERAGGYQVDQQARMNLGLVPQYGGTVGGVRRRALESVGGWRINSLAEDTDATFRLLLGGWKTVYQNRSECYEQVPNSWRMRIRQLVRWTQGHNEAMTRYSFALLRNGRTRFFEKLDGLLLLNVYLISTVLLLGWALAITLWFLGVSKPGLIVILAVTSYSTLGNFAIFFEIAAAAYLDGSRERIRLLPFLLPGFLVSLMTVNRATLTQLFSRRNGNDVRWHKTEHNNNHNHNHRGSSVWA